jgi:signal transduction histidine kinase
LQLAKLGRLCETLAGGLIATLMFRFQRNLRLRLPSENWGGWLPMGLLALAALAFPLRAADTTPTSANWLQQATNHLGNWIWDTNTFDKQTCRLWKSFEIPTGSQVTRAILHITVDNGYLLFLDGRELGRGSDWHDVTEYNVTQLLAPGRHCLAVEGFNDRLEAGLIFGLHIEFLDQTDLDVRSDGSWFVVPNTERNWTSRKKSSAEWRPVLVIGPIHHHPWEVWPYRLTIEPPFLPLVVHFWQTGWFQFSVLTLLLLAIGGCAWLQTQLAIQARSQRLLRAERERIARDIHDDLGAQLTQLVLLGEVAQREQVENSEARNQFGQICVLARELSHGMDEVVWAVNARRDTLRDFANFVCKYAKSFLDSTPIRCRLDVESDLPTAVFDLPVRRNLLLAVKEALNNAAKHSGATELFLRIYCSGHKLLVTVEDNGRGFDPSQIGGERNGMANMARRMNEISGVCELFSSPGAGCRVVFTAPLAKASRGQWLKWLRRSEPGEKG